MPISETIMWPGPPALPSLPTTIVASSTSKVLNYQSLLHITGNFRGEVHLQLAPNGTTNWLTILSYDTPTTLPISTPDLTVDYRFLCDLREGSVNLYLGE